METNSHLNPGQNPPVSLAPPGAGIPPLELFITSLGFAAARIFFSKARATRQFTVEAERMMALAKSLSPEDAQRRVLIKRITGIEDSSRFWSINMTLEHLNIVDRSIATLILQLSRGKTIDRRISTAEVKPPETNCDDALTRFEETTGDYLRIIDKISTLQTRMRTPHPWFGPLNGHGWHCLAAIHHTIHRRQMEEIIEDLQK